ncbi:MAG: hypothetical protein M3O26_02465 [Pseudomonadota bacterium]|nr:hypothetical protein [Pseudomonadota bacterium]
MSEHRSYYWPLLLILGSVSSWSASPEAHDGFAPQYGGYLVSTEFTIDSNTHAVISPPASARPGDLLSICPRRLNNDEYLVLQKCNPEDCTHALVVRAWNALGYMGPYPLISNKIPIEPGVRYMLWMQHISTQGGNSFSLYERSSPPLVFTPAGPAELFQSSDMKSAQKLGPTRIQRSTIGGTAFIATFEGGSVVRMQLLRAKGGSSVASLLPR